MNEAIGNSFVLAVIITFITIFAILFAASTAYTKAFKVKNKIIEIIEKYDDILGVDATSGNRLNAALESDINTTLSDIGYRISVTPNSCPERNGVAAISKQTTSNYEYCIYKYSTSKGNYYGVTAYMYFEIPVINRGLRFPVYGETKISRILGIGINK